MKKIILSLIVVYSMLLATACASAVSLDKAKSSSSRLASYANEGVNVTRELYRSKVLSGEQTKAIAGKFIVLARAGAAFDSAVKAAEATYGTNAPKPEIEKLFAVFSSEVVGNFLAVLSALKIVGNTGGLQQTIALLQTAVLTIARAFGRSAAVKRQIKGV